MDKHDFYKKAIAVVFAPEVKTAPAEEHIPDDDSSSRCDADEQFQYKVSELEIKKYCNITIPSKEWQKYCVAITKTLKIKSTKTTPEKTMEVNTYLLESGSADLLFKYFYGDNPYCLF